MVFEDLHAFVIVARHGSFTQAAAHLCVAQSALSKRVQRLEQRTGSALFERRARGLTLTDAIARSGPVPESEADYAGGER